MPTTEPTINDALATVLRELRRNWSMPQVVRSENTGSLEGGAGKKPDILIMEPGTSPVVVETEVVPATTVEEDAKERLGQISQQNGRRVFSSVAVRIPARLRQFEGIALTNEIRLRSRFAFACFTGETPDESTRWPTNGWITGEVTDLCIVCESLTIPPTIANQATNSLLDGVRHASGRVDEFASRYEVALRSIAATLKQEDGPQTRRMAMTILANAFVFHASLSGLGGALASLRPIETLKGASGRLSRGAVLEEWRKILAVNYWPIFDIARRILEVLPATEADEIITGLGNTAETILGGGLAQSHDLVGEIFQTLIADRKFLAAFYTRPASAALLSQLAVSRTQTPRGELWGVPNNVLKLRCADFACGSGTLLSYLYQAIRQNHELGGGNEDELHPGVMSDVLVGCDIMPIAVHITASMLSGAHPGIKYDSSSILLMPFGRQKDHSLCIGALDLLQAQGTFPVLTTSAVAVSARGTQSTNTWRTLADGSFDLVIMNPPFTRATNHAAMRSDVPNPVFAAFSLSEKDQKAMTARLKSFAENTAYNGNAGEWTAFVVLADQKLCEGGTLAMVLPLSFQTGGYSKGVRRLVAENYEDLYVVSIAAETDAKASFSADTGMAECLVVGRKTGKRSERTIFAILSGSRAGSACASDLTRRQEHFRKS